MITQSRPISMKPSSAVSTAPKPIAEPAPIRTSPHSTAVGATWALGSIVGDRPRCRYRIAQPGRVAASPGPAMLSSRAVEGSILAHRPGPARRKRFDSDAGPAVEPAAHSRESGPAPLRSEKKGCRSRPALALQRNYRDINKESGNNDQPPGSQVQNRPPAGHQP